MSSEEYSKEASAADHKVHAPIPVRVGYDLLMSARNRTGTGTYAVQLLRHLQRVPGLSMLPLNGWRCLDGCRGAPGRLARNFLDIAWTHVGLPLHLSSLGPDVLHTPAYVAPLTLRCPLVVTVHDVIYRRFPQHYARWWVQYLESLMPRVLRTASAIITVSEHAKRDITQAYDVDPSRIHVIYHGVDHRRFHEGVAQYGRDRLVAYGIRGEYVLHVGALVARKNIPLLLNAVSILKKEGTWGNRQVVLAGAASPGLRGAPSVAETIARLALDGDVILGGHVPGDDLPLLYANAAVLAFPSLYEGFGLPIVEAMACGTPVVARAGSAVTEIVGDAGMLVHGDDPAVFAGALANVLGNNDLRRTLRERGLGRTKDFTWQRCAYRTAQVYSMATFDTKAKGLG